jgi:uncharacterized protein DUF6527
MKRIASIQHRFVHFIPEALEDGTIYVSIEFATSVHKCFCGCGREVVTPLSPTDWELRYDGKSVSLYPSVGSWALPCRSHYWIRRDRVIWARQWSRSEIDEARAGERQEKKIYFEKIHSIETPPSQPKRKPRRR